MKEICVNKKALRAVVRNVSAGDIALAKIRVFIERGGLLPKKIVIFERNNEESDKLIKN